MRHKVVEEVQLALKAATSGSELLVGCWKEGSSIVLKDLTGCLKPDAIGIGTVGGIGRVAVWRIGFWKFRVALWIG